MTNPAAQTGVPAPPGARSAVSAPGAAEELVAARAALARATLLAEVTSDLALSLDVAGSLRRLARLVVPVLADWVLVDLADEDGLPVQVAMVHRDGRHDVVARFTELQPAGMTPQAPIMRVLAGAAPTSSTPNCWSCATSWESCRRCTCRSPRAGECWGRSR